MSFSPVNLTTGNPETVLPGVPPELDAALDEAVGLGKDSKVAIGRIVADHPTYLSGWARLSEAAESDIEAYAYARVGYHRGLDALRAAGWKGSGYVRWREPSNRGFLRALENMRAKAEAIGENTEAERCALFLRQLDPEWNGLPR